MIQEFGFFEISALSAMFPIAYGFFRIRHLTIALKILLWFVTTSFLFDVFNLIVSFQAVNNGTIINVYALVQSLFIAFFFLKIPNSRKGFVRWHILVLILALIANIIITVSFGVKPLFNVYSVCISSIGVLLHCGIFLIEYLRYNIENSISDDPYFYSVSSLFIYHSCVFMIFFSFELFNQDVSKELWNVKLAAYMLFNLFILISFITQVKSNKIIET